MPEALESLYGDEIQPGLLDRAKNFFSPAKAKPESIGAPLESLYSDQPPSQWGSKSIEFLKGLGGESLFWADMAISLPGWAGGVIAGTTATATRLAMGESPQTAYKTGREVGQTIAEPFINPLKRALDYFDSGKIYEESKTAVGMNKFAEAVDTADAWVTKNTNGKVPPGATAQAVDTLLLGLVGAPKAIKSAKDVQHIRDALKNKETYLPEDRSDFIVSPEGVARRPGEQQAGQKPLYRGPAAQAREALGTALVPADLASLYVKPPSFAPAAKPRLKGPAATVRGEADVEMLAALGLGASAGLIAKHVYDEAERSGRTAWEVIQDLGRPDYRKQWEEHEQRLKDAPVEEVEPGSGTALAAGAALAGLGWIKGKGGMWHPEAVRRLAQAVAPSADYVRGLLTPEELPKTSSGAWAERSVRNYLNKWAGTKEDPLKDIEIPFGEGTKRWEEITDKLIGSKPARLYEEMQPKGSKPDEPIYGIDPAWEANYGAKAESQALTSYLSHVGDYLRANVFLEKLQNYDLVRAVKETAAWDKDMARKAAKEKESASAYQLEQMKTMPVHKDYGDGFKWVQLTRPGEFAREATMMGNSVRGYEPPAKASSDYHRRIAGAVRDDTFTPKAHPDWIPESEYGIPSGQGSSGHPGYGLGGWEAIKRGDAKVYSLRDAKGESHVTVEVEPAKTAYNRRGSEALNRDGINLLEGNRISPKQVEKALLVTPDNILQIKGKQNRAPNAEYIPYVQDFVKSGKWGDVGDLQNTGLVDLLNNKKDLGFLQLAQKEFGNERYIPGDKADALWKQYIDSVDPQGPRGERGFSTPEFTKALGITAAGAIAGAAFADPADRLAGLIIGGGTALGLSFLSRSKATLQKAPASAFDYGLGLISTRLSNISPALRFQAVNFERRILLKTHEVFTRVAPFLQALNSVKDPYLEPLNRAILTNSSAEVNKLLLQIGDAKLSKGWVDTRRVLRELGTELKGEGRFGKLRPGYFPRIVVDREGLLNALGQDLKPRLEEVLIDAELKAVQARGTGLNRVEESVLINRTLQDWHQRSGQPGFAKAREIDQITEQLQPFYASPTESLHSYVRSAIEDLEKVRFFGKNIAETTKDGKRYTNLDASIGSVIQDELSKGDITYKQAEELTSIMKSRFLPGSRTSNPLIQDLKNAANLGLLGNVIASATQMGDLSVALYANGLKPTLTAVAQMATGRNKVSMREFGLVDHIAEEFVSTRTSAKALQLAFKLAGFSAIDQFGKNVALNAALNKYQGLAQTPKGAETITKKYGTAFKDELPQLLDDLKNKKDSDLVRSVLFAELSDIQPITRLEVPQAYLDMPNGRVIYMLKTFMLKQADVVRRDAYNEIKKGTVPSVARGLYNLTKFAVLLGTSGAIVDTVKDWLLGRDAKLEVGDILSNVLKTFGWSEYVIDKAKRGKPFEAALGIATPPYQIMDDLIRADPKAIQYVPILGKLYYSHFMGGKERTTERQAWRKIEQMIPSALISQRKQYRRDITNLARMRESGDEEGFKQRLSELEETYKLSPKQARRIEQDTRTDRIYRRFRTLPEDQQRAILEQMDSTDREKFLPHANKGLRHELAQ